MKLESFFKAKSVAVVGVSENPTKLGAVVFKNLLDAGFTGELYAVNPKCAGQELYGKPCVANVSDIGHPIDLVVVVVPAKFTMPVIDDAIAAGTKNISIITAGFGEVGNHELEDTIAEKCIKAGVNLLGPNCLGHISTYDNLNASFADGFPEKQPGIRIGIDAVRQRNPATQARNRQTAGHDKGRIPFETLFPDIGPARRPLHKQLQRIRAAVSDICPGCARIQAELTVVRQLFHQYVRRSQRAAFGLRQGQGHGGRRLCVAVQPAQLHRHHGGPFAGNIHRTGDGGRIGDGGEGVAEGFGIFVERRVVPGELGVEKEFLGILHCNSVCIPHTFGTL